MNRLDPLNNYLESQEPKQRIVLYIALVVLVFAMAYLFVFSDMSDEYESKNAELANKQSQLNKIKNASALKRISILNKNIKTMKSDIARGENISQKSQYASINLPSFKIDDSAFSRFLEGALEKAKIQEINLASLDINSQKLPFIGMLEIEKTITLRGSGRFLDILELVKYMESQEFLIKLKFIRVVKPVIKKNKEGDKKESKKNKLKKTDVTFFANFEVMGASK